MTEPEVVLPDGRRIRERRRRDEAHQRLLQRIASEPLASIAIGLTLAVLAWGTITSNTRNAEEASRAKVNAAAARDNAEAARSLAGTIKSAQEALARVGEASRTATFQSHQAMQDTLVCILAIQPEARTPDAVKACVKPLSPPPDPDHAGTHSGPKR